ncbi:MAG: TonB-dependent receptor plug domain-containing protein, partial [Rhodobacteraceae bacterium]|nr:TonB-dependent receptor plug domain-containing protein [Paracoccaceae bacterium]
MKIYSQLLLTFLFLVFTGTTVWPDSLGPDVRIIAARDRDFIERSGAQTLEELLDTGIVRYFYAGGQTLLILVDGRPYATSTSDLDTLPLSAIERIELLSGEGLGQYGGIAINGAINVVMRKDFDGVETRTLTRIPGEDGGEGWQGSVFWGGPVNDNGGRMSIGVDILKREAIPSRSREFSRSEWTEGGSFSEAKNISIGGNTLFVFDVETATYRTLSLGDCNPKEGYAGPLERPSAFAPPGDKGCGFAYGNIAWNTPEFEQRTAIVNLELPLEGGQDFHLFANLGQGKSSFRYAPSVGFFRINIPDSLLVDINDPDNGFSVDTSDYVAIAHRFLGHGNRDWHTNYNEYDISLGIDGQLTNNIDYKTSISTYNLDGSLIGNTFVHLENIQNEISLGNYDFTDPDSPGNQAAIERTSLQEEIDFGQEYFGAGFSLEGQTFSIADRSVAWTAGIDVGKTEIHSLMRFVDNQEEEYDVTEVLGSGGVSYQGKRQTIGIFGDMVLPITKNTDFRVAARGDDYDDLGKLGTYHLSTEHRPNNVLTLRSSWGIGDRAPSMRSLHSTESQDHPYVRCVPDFESQPDPPRE